MTRHNTKTTISLALMGLLFTAGAARADFVYPDEAPQENIDICVAAIDDRADFSDAGYVRHEVKTRPRATLGYILNISTQIYTENDGELIREYRTLCAVSKQPEPVAFRMREAY